VVELGELKRSFRPHSHNRVVLLPGEGRERKRGERKEQGVERGKEEEGKG